MLGVLGAIVLLGAFMIADGWTAFGTSASGARRARMQSSPQWVGDGFDNPEPLYNDLGTGFTAWLTEAADHRTPESPLPVVEPEPTLYDEAPESGLRVTWLGHSTMLVEIDGVRVLTDPVWGERTSPWTWIGPRRWYPPPIALEALPDVDVVLISHDHMDHLDTPTIEAMRDWDATFVTPLGVGAHLLYWGVPEARIVELDWWDRATVSGLEIVCTPARHASGRQLLDQNATLWAGYALLGAEHRVFFSGDTGLFDALREIGRRLGPFDLTMIEVGAYHRSWPDWHLGPEQAVLAHRMVRGRTMLPVHWGLFDLAMHAWTEPVERTVVAAREQGVTLHTPRPGQPFEPTGEPAGERWWPDVPWQTAEEHPVVATNVDRRVE